MRGLRGALSPSSACRRNSAVSRAQQRLLQRDQTSAGTGRFGDGRNKSGKLSKTGLCAGRMQCLSKQCRGENIGVCYTGVYMASTVVSKNENREEGQLPFHWLHMASPAPCSEMHPNYCR